MSTKFQWTLVSFGKYEGLTLPQILLRDPDYFFHAMERSYFRGRRQLVAEAAELHERATSIRIPGSSDANPLQIEHMIHRPTGKYQGFTVVPASKSLHEGASSSLRYEHLDMSVPRQFSTYDKTGGGLLIESMKPIYFGKQSARLTKQVCEDFFKKGSNFRLRPISHS